MLDKNTFGKSKSAENLVAILNEIDDKKVSHIVLKIINSFRCIMKDLENLKTTRKKVALLVKEKFIKDIITFYEMPKKVETHLRAVIIGCYKNLINK